MLINLWGRLVGERLGCIPHNHKVAGFPSLPLHFLSVSPFSLIKSSKAVWDMVYSSITRTLCGGHSLLLYCYLDVCNRFIMEFSFMFMFLP